MPVLRGALFFDRREKKARVEKNKKQNLQNQRRAMKESLSTVGSTVMDPRVRKTKTQAEAAYDIACTATASVGKFDDQTQVGTHLVRPPVVLSLCIQRLFLARGKKKEQKKKKLRGTTACPSGSETPRA